MPSAENGNGINRLMGMFVSWRWFGAGISAWIIAGITYVNMTIAAHSSLPHPNAVSIREFEKTIEEDRRERDDLRREIRELNAIINKYLLSETARRQESARLPR